MRACFVALCLGALGSIGCATGGGNGDAGGGDEDAGRAPDAGPEVDAGGDPTMCPSGQHLCGGGCIDDQPNMIENGCRLGCGEPCPTPPDGAASCGSDGLCSFACPPPFHNEGGECVCTPSSCEALAFQCGAPDDGCGTPLNCGSCDGEGICTDGRCSCPADAQEPNEGTITARNIGSMNDADNPTLDFPMFGLHSASDVDWYTIAVTDGFDGGNPQIRVYVGGAAYNTAFPTGSDYGLTVYYVCSSGGDASDCLNSDRCRGTASGTSAEMIEFGTDCSGLGIDDDGTLFIGVSSSTWGGSCAPYSLRVDMN